MDIGGGTSYEERSPNKVDDESDSTFPKRVKLSPSHGLQNVSQPNETLESIVDTGGVSGNPSIEVEPLTINDLFDEILQKIFSYFPAQEVFGHLSKVCTRWERIAKDPSTLNETQLFLEHRDIDHYMEVLKEAPCIGEVYILPTFPFDALSHLIEGPKIKKLVIIADSEWHSNWPSPTDLLALLTHNKLTLQILSMPIDSGLVQCHKTQECTGTSFQSLIAGMKRLTHLHLIGECWRDWDAWDLTQEHPYLQTLKIDSITFISDECPFIRDLILLCKSTLRTLHLPCQLPRDAVSLLNAGVFQGSQVEELMVSTGCLRIVSQMPHLKILAIFDNGKEDKDLDIFKNMPMLCGVGKLTLQSIVEGEGEKEGFVWHLLSKFNNVTEFWGLESSVEEATFNMFLSNNTFLREMHFFDFSGFENPSQVLLLEKFHTNLTLLDLSLTNVTDDMKKALKQFNEGKPNLQILLDDFEDEVYTDIHFC